jgi:tripartite-type tricarboxylate transporter receptor subunit TctC
MPNVQTMAEAGIKNVELVVWVGVFAPAKTPPDVANKLHAALIKSLGLDDVKAGFARDGMDIITDESPDAFRKVLAADIEKWGKVIKAANIPLQ